MFLFCLIMTGCLLPADIRERPEGDQEEYEYWPVITNSLPSGGKQVMVKSCEYARFSVIFAEAPDPDDEERNLNFSVRWYLDRSSNPNPIVRTRGWSDFKMTETIQFDTLDSDGTYLLEVFVSDLGFDDSQREPLVNPGAHSDRWTWEITFDQNIDNDNPEDCQWQE